MRHHPDRFDGDAHPGAIADYCPACGYPAPPGELSTSQPVCPACGESLQAPRSQVHKKAEPGANTWS
jgi:hypothetical protein